MRGEHTVADATALELGARARAVCDALSAVVLGQADVVRDVVTALLAAGHVLLEGVPGVAKTLLARALAQAVAARFTRVQFTPDLMPTDLTGTRIFSAQTRSWELHRGPIFTDVLLADEINRTPPKTQAALLEAMEERQVTLDGERLDLGATFFVIATQNPLEFEGTYPLPEAQTDRFLMKVRVGYPDTAAELALYAHGEAQHLDAALENALLSKTELAQLRAAVARVRVESSVVAYALALVHATRANSALKLGASPRAGLMLLRAARARALLDGRAYVLPDDVKAVVGAVFRHRLVLSTEAELDGQTADGVVADIVASTSPLAPVSDR